MIHAPSLEERLQNTERALQEAGYKPDIPIEQFKNRRSLQRLLERREQLAELVSSDSQRVDYGIEAWNNDYMLLSELEEFPKIANAGNTLPAEIWKQVPNSRFSRFQELFCDALIVPRFDFDAKRRPFSRGRIDFNTLTLKGCIVNPERISDKLAEDLHLADFSEDEGKPLDRIARKQAAIPRLKRWWESMVPLEEGHHRLLVVGPGNADIAARYPGVPGPDPLLLGSLICVRGGERRKGKDSFAGKRIVQFFDDSVYGASRKSFREQQQYDVENSLITECERKLTNINKKLAAKGGNTPENRAEAQEIMTGVVDAFSACSNHYKQEAHDMLKASMDFKDSRGRNNLTVALTKMVGSINNIKRRFREMVNIAGFNEHDCMVLYRVMVQSEADLSEFRAAVLRGETQMLRSEQLFGSDALSDDVVSKNVQRITQAMRLNPEPLKRLHVQPFNVYAEALLQKHGEFMDALQARHRQRAKTALVSMHLIGKFQEVQSVFELIKFKVIDREHVTVGMLADKIKKLRAVFTTRQIFPELVIPSYIAHFEQMSKGLEILERGLLQYALQDMTLERKSEMYENLVKYLDTFDCVQIVRDLLEHQD